MDDDRAAQIFVEGVGSSSGYAITTNCILTARHALHSENRPPAPEKSLVDFRLWGDLKEGECDWRHAYLLWSHPVYDVALLSIDAEEIAKSQTLSKLKRMVVPAVIGRLPMTGDFESETFGWPRIMRRGEERQPMPFRGKTTGRGRSSDEIIRAIATDLTPKEESGWKGISGAALQIQDLIVGVVIHADDRFKEGVLEALPLASIERETAFWRHLAACPVRDVMLHLPSVPVPTEQVPKTYVDRPELTQAVLAALLDETEVQSGRAVIAAIHGLGGIGKTTLAASIAWHSSVAARYPDGRLWLTLGQESRDSLTILTDWLAKLGHPDKKPKSEAEARGDLASILQDKAVLVVIDDVWPSTAMVAEMLMVPATRSSYLITTRFAELPTDLKAQLFEVGELSRQEATTLLERNLGRRLTDSELPLALQLAEAVGYHPQALELAAARVARGKSWNNLIEGIAAELSRLEELEEPASILRNQVNRDEAAHRRRSVRASLNLSVKELSEPAQRRFAWFGALPDKATITEGLAATLWSVPSDDATDVLDQLADISLLKRAGEGRYRMHDLVHDLTRRMMASPSEPERDGDLPGLGMNLEEASRLLLERYRARTTTGNWNTLADDGYIYEHLVRHFAYARDADGLFALLVEGEERNAWAEARLKREGTYAGYQSDLQLAWESCGPGRWSIGQQIRWLLAVSSVNSLVNSVNPVLLPHLVKHGIWTPAAALNHVKFIPDNYVQRKALSAIMPTLPPTLRSDASTLFREIYDSDKEDPLENLMRRSGLEEIFSFLSDDQKEDSLDVAREIKASWLGAPILSELAPDLTDRQRNEALRALGEITNETTKSQTITALAPYLSPAQIIPTFALIRDIGDDWQRGIAVAALIRQLPDALKAEAVEIIADLRNEVIASYAIRTAVVSLSRSLQLRLLNVAQRLSLEWLRHETLRVLVVAAPELFDSDEREAAALQLSDVVRRDVITRLTSMNDEEPDAETRASALAHLTEILPHNLGDDLWNLVVAEVHAIPEQRRADTLTSLVPLLRADLKHNLISLAEEITDAKLRAKVLIKFITLVPAPARDNTAGMALKAIEQISGDEMSIATALDGLMTALAQRGERLSEDYQAQAVAVAQSVGHSQARAIALSSVIDYLREDQRDAAITEVLRAMWRIDDDQYRSWGLRDLVTNLRSISLEVLAELLKAVHTIGEGNRWYFFSGLIEQLGPFLSSAMLSSVLQEVIEMHEPQYVAWTLNALAKQVPEDLKRDVFACADRISMPAVRVGALVEMAPNLPTDLAARAATNVIADLDKLPTPTERLNALARLASIQPDTIRPLILSLVSEVSDTQLRANALASIAGSFPDLIEDALAQSMQILDPKDRFNILSGLATTVSAAHVKPILERALNAIDECDEPWDKAFSFGEWLGLITGTDLEERVLRVAVAIKLPNARAHALKQLIEFVGGPTKTSTASAVLDSALEIQDEWERMHALEGLNLNLLGERVNAAMELLRGLTEPAARAHGLINMKSFEGDSKIAVVREALNALRDLYERQAFWDSRMWNTLADDLPESLRSEALGVALDIPDERSRADALTGFARCLSADLALRVLKQAPAIEDVSSRSKVLSALVGRLPQEDGDKALQEALSQSDDESVATYGWKHSFEPLVSRWFEIDLSRLTNGQEIWTKITTALRRRNRGDVFWDIGALAPIIYRLGGINAIRDTLRGIDDVGRWSSESSREQS